jgi:hypothetical protein
MDDVGDHYDGVVVALNKDSSLPAMYGEFVAPKGLTEFNTRIPLAPVERATGMIYSEDKFKAKYPSITSPSYAESEWKVSPSGISIKWSTDIKTNGQGTIKKSEGDKSSTLEASTSDWANFKNYAAGLEPYRHLFRGQENNTWKLRTSFYRTGRANLFKFMREDVNTLHRHLSGLTTHRFDLGNALDYAAFLALVQHHGYPTPLLDWTQSPFIAAYFAYRNLDASKIRADQFVRIHIFDGRLWNARMERAGVISPAFLHMTLLEPLAINNPRVVPQQSASMVTNVDDLEWYVRDKESGDQTTFLKAIDLPAAERPTVLRELALMGINAGSLFPGLDGACTQVRERYFNV